MVTKDDLYRRVRLLKAADGHPAGRECTMIEFETTWVMLEFDDGDWGTAVSPDAVERIRECAEAS